MTSKILSQSVALFITAAIASSAQATALKLKCELQDNIDPSPNRFQFLLTNLGPLTKFDLTLTVPVGATANVTVTGKGVLPGYPISVTYTFVTTLAPTESVTFPRIPLGSRCTATANW